MTSDITELLGGAARGKTRPRGFVPWSPQARTLALIARVQAVLGEYEDHLPLTLRQIFYRLVGAHGYETILHDAIEARIDRRAFARVLRREREVRRELMARLS
jgi:hypothetical protein